MPSTFSPDQELFTTKEAAQYLHCSPRTLEKRRTNGQEPAFIKDGWSVQYHRADLDAFIASTGNFIHGSLTDDAVVAKIVAAAPSFSEEQRQQLARSTGRCDVMRHDVPALSDSAGPAESWADCK